MTSAAGKVQWCNLKLFFSFFLFFWNTATAGDVQMYSWAMSFVFLSSTNHFTKTNIDGGKPDNLSLPYNNVFLIAELHPRAKHARGRSPIAKEMW